MITPDLEPNSRSRLFPRLPQRQREFPQRNGCTSSMAKPFCMPFFNTFFRKSEAFKTCLNDQNFDGLPFDTMFCVYFVK